MGLYLKAMGFHLPYEITQCSHRHGRWWIRIT